jgi:hypothetical protein
VSLRIWDIFLNEGNKVLFRIALAILKVYEDELLQIHDTVDFYEFFKRKLSKDFDNVDLLFAVAYKDYQPNNINNLKSYTDSHSYQQTGSSAFTVPSLFSTPVRTLNHISNAVKSFSLTGDSKKSTSSAVSSSQPARPHSLVMLSFSQKKRLEQDKEMDSPNRKLPRQLSGFGVGHTGKLERCDTVRYPPVVNLSQVSWEDKKNQEEIIIDTKQHDAETLKTAKRLSDELLSPMNPEILATFSYILSDEEDEGEDDAEDDDDDDEEEVTEKEERHRVESIEKLSPEHDQKLSEEKDPEEEEKENKIINEQKRSHRDSEETENSHNSASTSLDHEEDLDGKKIRTASEELGLKNYSPPGSHRNSDTTQKDKLPLMIRQSDFNIKFEHQRKLKQKKKQQKSRRGGSFPTTFFSGRRRNICIFDFKRKELFLWRQLYRPILQKRYDLRNQVMAEYKKQKEIEVARYMNEK